MAISKNEIDIKTLKYLLKLSKKSGYLKGKLHTENIESEIRKLEGKI